MPDCEDRRKRPRIVVTGSTGQVGWELVRSLSLLGEVLGMNRERCDLLDSDRLRETLRDIRPDLIVNAAAYTAVDKAETEEHIARKVNQEAVGILAQAAGECGALVLHYSTDYVFDGTKQGAYLETDDTNPINVYGATKRDGERALLESGCDHLILRTSWVYAARGRNFLLTVLRLAGERTELRVVDDQRGAPTWARTISDATAHIAKQALEERREERFHPGIVNLTSSGSTTWHGFAAQIVERAAVRGLLPRDHRPTIIAIPSSEYPTPARRPANSVLSLAALSARYGVYPPRWDDALDQCMEEIRQ